MILTAGDILKELRRLFVTAFRADFFASSSGAPTGFLVDGACVGANRGAFVRGAGADAGADVPVGLCLGGRLMRASCKLDFLRLRSLLATFGNSADMFGLYGLEALRDGTGSLVCWAFSHDA